jgi:hypothetical protein
MSGARELAGLAQMKWQGGWSRYRYGRGARPLGDRRGSRCDNASADTTEGTPAFVKQRVRTRT